MSHSPAPLALRRAAPTWLLPVGGTALWLGLAAAIVLQATS